MAAANAEERRLRPRPGRPSSWAGLGVRQGCLPQAAAGLSMKPSLLSIDSLADAIVRALDHAGAFNVSEGMRSMQDVALAVRAHAHGTFVSPLFSC